MYSTWYNSSRLRKFLRNSSPPIRFTSMNASQWSYQSHAKWILFDSDTNNLFETAFQNRNMEYSNPSKLKDFEVDFQLMKCRRFGVGDWCNIFRGQPPQNTQTLNFFALGDWGYAGTALHNVAKSMDIRSRDLQPSCILALGDNFYPRGVDSVIDPAFQWCWENVFLKYNSLRVPWQVILGNHDYDGNPTAQIEFSTFLKNPGGLWRLPSKCYTFSHVTPSGKKVDFFGIDTNGAQNSVRRKYPQVIQELLEYRKWLSDGLKSSDATWKIVFAHHPLYTKSCAHGTIGRCLRDHTYTHKNGVSQGFALEDVLVDGHVDAFFSGHEHVFQHHFARGIHHFVCGASGAQEIRFYGGEDYTTEITWHDKSLSRFGFTSVSIGDSEMEVVFNDAVVGEIYRVKIVK